MLGIASVCMSHIAQISLIGYAIGNVYMLATILSYAMVKCHSMVATYQCNYAKVYSMHI